MKIAVLSLTRDRLSFTQHCFARLREFAGCEFDHYVFDNGSGDETVEWLRDHESDFHVLIESPQNIGISRAMNELLRIVEREEVGFAPYDVIVKIDNDCELVQPDTLRDVCDLTLVGGALLSPRILGLQNPPQPTREAMIAGDVILDIPQIGGIFLAAPAWVYSEFRYSESNPPWGMDDVEICRWWRSKGGTCGYVNRLEAWHYLGTEGQRDTDPAYFVRKDAEFAA